MKEKTNPKDKKNKYKPRIAPEDIENVKAMVLRAIWDENAPEWSQYKWSDNITDRLKSLLSPYQIDMQVLYRWRRTDTAFAIEYYQSENAYYQNKAEYEVGELSSFAQSLKGMPRVLAHSKVLQYYTDRANKAQDAAEKMLQQEAQAEQGASLVGGFWEALKESQITIDPNQKNKLNIDTDHMGNPIAE